MKTLFFIVALCILMSVAVSGHKGIKIGIPVPFIKIRFVNIASLFGGHEGGHHGGGFGGHGGFGVDIDHGHHGW